MQETGGLGDHRVGDNRAKQPCVRSLAPRPRRIGSLSLFTSNQPIDPEQELQLDLDKHANTCMVLTTTAFITQDHERPATRKAH